MNAKLIRATEEYAALKNLDSIYRERLIYISMRLKQIQEEQDGEEMKS